MFELSLPTTSTPPSATSTPTESEQSVTHNNHFKMSIYIFHLTSSSSDDVLFWFRVERKAPFGCARGSGGDGAQ